MTREEIERVYPDCADAVLYHESLPCWWTIVGRDDLDGVLVMLKRGLCACHKTPEKARSIPEAAGRQMDAPGFRRYVAAKLGMM